MGHTNSTANLSLPQFIGTDKPTWLGDVNGAFSAIDAYAGTNDAAVSAAASAAANAVADASNAVTTATNANTTAGNASSTATAANTVAGQALTVANGTDTKVGALVDLATTDKSSIVNAINEVNTLASSRTIAISAAGQSYGDQLTELATAFSALSNAEKERCILVRGTAIHHIGSTAGDFSRVIATSSGFEIKTLDLDSIKYYVNSNGTSSDETATNDNRDLYLILI